MNTNVQDRSVTVMRREMVQFLTHSSLTTVFECFHFRLVVTPVLFVIDWFAVSVADALMTLASLRLLLDQLWLHQCLYGIIHMCIICNVVSYEFITRGRPGKGIRAYLFTLLLFGMITFVTGCS